MREAKAMPFGGILSDIEQSFRDTESEGFQARLIDLHGLGPVPGVPRDAPQQEKRGRACRPGPAPGSASPASWRMDIAAAHEFAGGLVEALGPTRRCARWSSGSSGG